MKKYCINYSNSTKPSNQPVLNQPRSTDLTIINQDNFTSAIDEVNRRFYDIPFENSRFQTEQFVLAAQITPERSYRQIGLSLNSKLQALQEAKFGKMKLAIDIDELNYKIANVDTDQFERRRLEVELLQKQSSQAFCNKLINDAIVECNILYHHMKAMPEYTREQFEAGEESHFTQRLTRAVNGVQGAAESLVNINTDYAKLIQFEQDTLKNMQLIENNTTG